tara:strand:- start:3674 stop:4018 length:345 start_codon:yes stop_codon:yes gene_type:complete
MRGGRIAIAAAQTVTKKVTKSLVARKAAKVAAKKAAEARARAQQRARAEREERRKMLEQNKKKAGTSDLDRVNKDLKNADNDRNKEILKKVAQKSAIVGSAVNNERRKMKANAE